MSDWIDVCEVEKLHEHTFRLVQLEDIGVLVFNIDGDFYALEDMCSHDGGPLSDGEIEDCEIICPRHGARFDIISGRVTAPPAYEDLHVFPTRIYEGVIQIRDDRWDL